MIKKIALLTSATGGGGGIAAVRVYESLIGVKNSGDIIDLIDIESLGGPVPQDITPHNGGSNKIFSDTHFTVEYPGYVRSSVIEKLFNYEAINIHWCSYLITIAEIMILAKLGVRIVFTCHDFYYFLGGCHYPHTCSGWQSGCIACPQLDRTRFAGYLPSDNLARKHTLFTMKNVILTAPSHYLTEMAARIIPYIANRPVTIRNPLDFSLFNRTALNRKASRNSVKVLLIADSARERRKAFPLGIQAVISASKKLAAETIELELLIVGEGSDDYCSIATENGVRASALGRMTVIELSEIYKDADILFSPSLEDNWPNTLCEAYACGAEIVVGPGHGCAEFVLRYSCGVVSNSFSVEDLSCALVECSLSFSSALDSQLGNENYKRFKDEHSNSAIGAAYYSILVAK